MQVIPVEFVDEAKAVLKSFGRESLLSPDIRIVALHPKVKAFFAANGIPVDDTLPYFDNDAQHRIILKCEDVSAALVREVRIEDGFGITKGYTEALIHHIRLYITHFLWLIEVLKGIDKVCQPDEIICPSLDGQATFKPRGPYLDNQERFLAGMAQKYCRLRNIRFRAIPVNSIGKEKLRDVMAIVVRRIGCFTARSQLRTFVAGLTKQDEVLVVPALSYRMDTVLKDIQKRRTGLKSVMIWEGGHSLKQEIFKIYFSIKNELKKRKGENVVESIINVELIEGLYRRQPEQQQEIDRQMECLVQFVLTQDYCQYDGVSFSEELAGKIDFGLRAEIKKLQHYVNVLADVFQKIRPRLLMSMYSAGVTYMMGELSHVLGFESLNITHGTHVPPHNRFEEIENYRLSTSVISNTYKHVSLQTPWAEKFLNYYEDPRPRLKTGPLLFSVTDSSSRERFRRNILGIREEDRVIVHATTQKDRSGFRFHITETLDEYLATVRDLVKAVNQLDNVYLLLRPHPICDLTEEEFRMLLPPCPRLVIHQGGAFAPVLSAADALVSYSSTCIEEALQNRVPVLLYDRWKRYNHFGIEPLASSSGKFRWPVSYLSEPHLLRDVLNSIFIPDNNPSNREQTLLNHTYPKDIKENFYQYISQTLEQGTSREYRFNYGQRRQPGVAR